ncbi:MAG: GTP cyclohydrolase FolE2 [Burkholderiales bacterium]|nr:GTP cyclohydrolase FolE2 [Burkholderiales bacterium]
MNAPERLFLPDIQASPDGREVAIDRVGVKSIRHPVKVRRPDGSVQASVALFDMYVGLPHHVKGTHMSRFLEVLAAEHEPVSPAGFRRLAARMLARLDADSGYLEMRFPYFIEKRAPVSGVASLLDYDVAFRAEVTPARGLEFSVAVVVPVTSLCPCSKKISDYGAPNQRSHITITATLAEDLAIEELAAIAEREASCEVYGLLKRPDEKYVTERAYDNPKFVEDLVRDVALALERDARVVAFTVESENFESIHNHSAYALIRRDKRTA